MITSATSPIVLDPVPVPLAPGAAEAFFNDFRAAMHDYPEQFVELEIVEVDFPGDVPNTGAGGPPSEFASEPSHSVERELAVLHTGH